MGGDLRVGEGVLARPHLARLSPTSCTDAGDRPTARWSRAIVAAGGPAPRTGAARASLEPVPTERTSAGLLADQLILWADFQAVSSRGQTERWRDAGRAHGGPPAGTRSSTKTGAWAEISQSGGSFGVCYQPPLRVCLIPPPPNFDLDPLPGTRQQHLAAPSPASLQLLDLTSPIHRLECSNGSSSPPFPSSALADAPPLDAARPRPCLRRPLAPRSVFPARLRHARGGPARTWLSQSRPAGPDRGSSARRRATTTTTLVRQEAARRRRRRCRRPATAARRLSTVSAVARPRAAGSASV